MNVVVSLIRDNLANLQRFVSGNLAGGADHLLIALDGPHDRSVYDFLTAHDRVSWVLGDAKWWTPPNALSARQRWVANLANFACQAVEDVGWLFFVDGDEIVLLDRGVLDAVPAGVRAVRLLPVESVAQREAVGGEFKRLLTPDELDALTRAGVIDRPDNSEYFHGHVAGKVGIRPAPDLRFRLHAVEDSPGHKVSPYRHSSLRHLHFESPTFADFVRKWTSMATSGTRPSVRRHRARILDTFIELADEPDPGVQQARQLELYERFVLDDVATLRALGFLETIDLRSSHEATPGVPRAWVTAFEGEVERLGAMDKATFASRR